MERVKPDRIEWTPLHSRILGSVFKGGDQVGTLWWDMEDRSFADVHAWGGFKIKIVGDDPYEALQNRVELWADEPNILAAQWLELCAQ